MVECNSFCATVAYSPSSPPLSPPSSLPSCQVVGQAFLTTVAIEGDARRIRQMEADGVLPNNAALTAVRRESGERLKRAMLSLGPAFVKGE